MKIDRITTRVVDLGGGFSWGDRQAMNIIGVWLRLETDDGVSGNAAAWTGPLPAAGTAQLIDELAQDVLLGADPMERANLMSEFGPSLRVGLPIPVAGVVDCALWDLFARVVGQPIHRLLGTQRKQLRACASAPAVSDVVACEEMIADIRDQGFTAVKLHVHNDLEVDIACARAARYAAGPDMALMMDAMGLYSRQDALRMGQVLDELEYHWFEDPLAEDDLSGWIELRAAVSTPLAGVDSVRHSVKDYATMIALGPFDIVRMDAARNGISELHALSKLAVANGLQCEAHSFGPLLAQAANIQVAMAGSSGSFFELPVPLGGLDLGASGGFSLDDDGNVALPDGPGNGLAVDTAALSDMVVGAT
ncbi:MAG: enolase C-terminal domain-like protein [Pseudomonadota bacterium]